MGRVHIFASGAIALCAVGVLLGKYLDTIPGMHLVMGASYYTLCWLALASIVIAVLILLTVVLTVISGKGRSLLKWWWLSLINAAASAALVLGLLLVIPVRWG
jgi:hypothetical protein